MITYSLRFHHATYSLRFHHALMGRICFALMRIVIFFPCPCFELPFPLVPLLFLSGSQMALKNPNNPFHPFVLMILMSCGCVKGLSLSFNSPRIVLSSFITKIGADSSIVCFSCTKVGWILTM